MSASDIAKLGVRIEAVGADEAVANIEKFKSSIRSMPKILDDVDKSSQKVEVSLRKLSYSVFGLSLSVTSIIQQGSRYQRQLNEIEKSEVAIARTRASVESQTLRLAKTIEKYGADSKQAEIASAKLRATIASLETKEKDLEIATGNLTESWIQFAVSLSSSVLFSIVGLREALKGVSAAQVRQLLTTNLLTLGTLRNRDAIGSAVVANNLWSASAIRASIANIGLASTIKLLLASIPVLGWAALAVTGAYTVYETNVGGVKDSLHKLLGIESEEERMHRIMQKTLGDTNDELADYSEFLDDATVQQEEMFGGTESVARQLGLFRKEIESTSAALDGYSNSVSGVGKAVRGNAGVAGVGADAVANSGSGISPEVMSMVLGDFGPITQKRNLQNNQNWLNRFDRTSLIKSNADSFASIIEQERELNKRRQLTEALERRIFLLYADENGVLNEQGRIMQRALDLAEARVRAENRLNTEKKKGSDLDKEAIKDAEELKKKLSETFGFLSPGSNRRGFIDGLTNFFTGENGMPFSGVINRRTGDILFQNKEHNPFQTIESFVEAAKENQKLYADHKISKAVFTANAYMLQAEMHRALSGPTKIVGTSSLINLVRRTRALSDGIINGEGYGTDDVPGEFSDYFNPRSRYGQRPNYPIGGGADAAMKAFSASYAKINSRDPKDNVAAEPMHLFIARMEANNEARLFRASQLRRDLSKGQRYQLAINQAMRDAPSWVFGGINGRNRDTVLIRMNNAYLAWNAGIQVIRAEGLPDPGSPEQFSQFLAEAYRRRRDRERAMVIGGLEERLDRETRFKSHVDQYGIQSVMGSGGTAVQYATLIPQIRQAVDEILSSKEYDKFWELAIRVKPVY